MSEQYGRLRPPVGVEPCTSTAAITLYSTLDWVSAATIFPTGHIHMASIDNGLHNCRLTTPCPRNCRLEVLYDGIEYCHTCKKYVEMHYMDIEQPPIPYKAPSLWSRIRKLL